MDYICELHVHSKYAGACSDRLTLENLDLTSKIKGIGIIGTGDFTHPLWLKEIKSKLVAQENGLLKLKGSSSNVHFMPSAEVCTISSKDGSGKMGMFDKSGSVSKIHHGIFAPNTEVMEQINAALAKFGSLEIDGRPQLKMTPSQLVETLIGIDKRVFVFPAHAWTPWFGVFGSFSGYDTIEDAYEDQAKHIYALETGLSSDPAMNWRISKLDKYALISGGDAHSLPKLGREATVMEIEEKKLSYDLIINSLKEKKVKMTVEFYPEEGKYHYDGHRNCNNSMSPEETKKYNGMCPVCGRRVTIGVLHRVNELADREEGYTPKGAAPFVHAIPLQEIIAYVTKKGVGTAYVQKAYDGMINAFGTEFDVLLKSDMESISKVDKELAKAIENVREEKVNIIPGYDGVFGIIDIANRVKSERKKGAQSSMNDFK